VFGKFPLDQLLAIPARHIKKFAAALKLFLESTPVRDKGWFTFHEALEEFEDVAERLARARTQGENIKKLIDVKEKLKDFDGNKSDLVDVGRMFLHEDSVTLVNHVQKTATPTVLMPKGGGSGGGGGGGALKAAAIASATPPGPYMLFLFNDCIELTQKQSGLMSSSEVFQHVAKFSISGMKVDDLPDGESVKNPFRIDLEEDTITLSAHGPAQKVAWVNKLRAAVAELRKTQVFGADPEAIMKRESEQDRIVPRLVDDAIACIEKSGVESEGIFRISASAKLIASL
jgi:hypothetical protein